MKLSIRAGACVMAIGSVLGVDAAHGAIAAAYAFADNEKMSFLITGVTGGAVLVPRMTTPSIRPVQIRCRTI